MSKINLTPARFVALTAVLAAAGYFIYPGPQMRETERARVELESRRKVEREADRQEEERLAAAQVRRKREEDERAILAADRAAITQVVNECKSAILSELSAESPFEVYMAYYSPDDLKRLADIGAAMGQQLGRPSVALDDYQFDAIAWNVERIMDKEYPLRSVAFAIEHAVEGFTTRRYAAIFACEMEGLKALKPSRTDIYYMD